jgi:hypothetical protein
MAATGKGLWSLWIIMSTTQRSLLAALLLLSVGFGLRAAFLDSAHKSSGLLQPRAEIALDSSPAPEAAVAAVDRPRAPVETPVPEGAPDSPVAAPITTALVDVLVRSEETGAALAGLGVRSFPSTLTNPFLYDDAKLTDQSGRARFEVRAPVRCGFYVSIGGSEFVDLEPGETRTVELLVANVRVVQVTVVGPDGAPVGDAGVWLSDSSNSSKGMIVGRTSDDGRFEVVTSDRNDLGARKAGHLASRLAGLQNDVREVQLALRGPAGRLHGVVRDDLGAPVSGAVLQLGVARNSLPPGPEGKSITGAPGARVRTDPDGRFRFDECEPGRQPLVARAEGFAMDQRTITTTLPEDGALAEDPFAALPELEIVLARAVTIEGWVTDAGGQPLA